MFFLLLRMLNEDMEKGRISREEYAMAIEKIASIHGIRKNGIR
jgi:hypothetical protein